MRNAGGGIKLLLTGGGTGGHLFPAIAAAQEFQRQVAGAEVLFIGTKRKVDTQSLARYGFSANNIVSFGIKGKNPVELIKAMAVLPFSCLQAIKIIRRFRPHIIFGVGGYVTGPVILAGRILGVPTVIHEQNSVPGLANRKLGMIVDKVCLSLPGSGEFFPSDKIVYTGNPVRRNILDLANNPPAVTTAKRTLLVLGGSQGAQAVNRLVADGILSMSEEMMADIRVIHQTGEADVEMVTATYRAKGIEAMVKSFFTDMAEVYGQADLLVSRAGATTLSEISVLGKPAILIPYPSAADNHQEKNADYYVAGGGAVQYRQSELDGGKLADVIVKLLWDTQKLTEMGEAMLQLAVPKAAENIVECCLEMIERYHK